MMGCPWPHPAMDAMAVTFVAEVSLWREGFKEHFLVLLCAGAPGRTATRDVIDKKDP